MADNVHIELKDMTDRDLLVQLVTIVNGLKGSWEEFQEGPGAARCQLHSQDIKAVKKTLTWAKSTAVGTLLTLIIFAIEKWWSAHP